MSTLNTFTLDANGDKLSGPFHWKCVFATRMLHIKEANKVRILDSLMELTYLFT